MYLLNKKHIKELRIVEEDLYFRIDSYIIDEKLPATNFQVGELLLESSSYLSRFL